jgi:hypothetical protein
LKDSEDDKPHGHSTVHHQIASGHEARLVGSQKNGAIRYILHAANSPEG